MLLSCHFNYDYFSASHCDSLTNVFRKHKIINHKTIQYFLCVLRDYVKLKRECSCLVFDDHEGGDDNWIEDEDDAIVGFDDDVKMSRIHNDSFMNSL